MSAVLDDPILRDFSVALADLYGERLQGKLLYGSRARGDSHAQSDYDVAVFLDPLPDFWTERMRLADLRVRFMDEAGVFLDAMPMKPSAIDDPASPLMFEIRRDGLSF